jgi:YVTN family beta-propeller protein
LGKRRTLLLSFLLLSFLLFISGCQFKTYQRVPDQNSVLAVANVKESSVSFIDIETGAQLAKWKLDFSFTRVLLMPDHETLMIYGRHNPNVTFINMSTGKLKQWKLGEGISNAALSADEKMIFFAERNLNKVLLYNLEGEKHGEVEVGDSPYTMIPTPDGKTLIVYNLNGSSFSIVDLSTLTVKDTIPTNENPMGGLYIPERDEIWVGGHGAGAEPEQNISVFSLMNGEKKGEYPAPLMPVDFVTLDGKYAFVLSHGTNMLYRIDISTGKETGRLQLGANPLGLAAGKQMLYVSSYDSDQVFEVDPVALKVTKTFNVGSGPLQIVVREGVRK